MAATYLKSALYPSVSRTDARQRTCSKEATKESAYEDGLSIFAYGNCKIENAETKAGDYQWPLSAIQLGSRSPAIAHSQ
jgi:hypothetical protein